MSKVCSQPQFGIARDFVSFHHRPDPKPPTFFAVGLEG